MDESHGRVVSNRFHTHETESSSTDAVKVLGSMGGE
jgi:hypothetical protein